MLATEVAKASALHYAAVAEAFRRHGVHPLRFHIVMDAAAFLATELSRFHSGATVLGSGQFLLDPAVLREVARMPNLLTPSAVRPVHLGDWNVVGRRPRQGAEIGRFAEILYMCHRRMPPGAA